MTLKVQTYDMSRRLVTSMKHCMDAQRSLANNNNIKGGLKKIQDTKQMSSV